MVCSVYSVWCVSYIHVQKQNVLFFDGGNNDKRHRSFLEQSMCSSSSIIIIYLSGLLVISTNYDIGKIYGHMDTRITTLWLIIYFYYLLKNFTHKNILKILQLRSNILDGVRYHM